MITNHARALRALRALLATGAVASALALSGCASTPQDAANTAPSAAASGELSPSAPSPTESGKKEEKDKTSSAPASQPSQATTHSSQPAVRTIDCALAQDALGAYFPAFSGFATAMSSGDPGEVFTAARQFSDVLNGFEVALPGVGDNAKVFIALSKEATRIALAASEAGDPAALATAATEIETLLNGDAERYTSGQEELQEYLDANCGVAP